MLGWGGEIAAHFKPSTHFCLYALSPLLSSAHDCDHHVKSAFVLDLSSRKRSGGDAEAIGIPSNGDVPLPPPTNAGRPVPPSGYGEVPQVLRVRPGPAGLLRRDHPLTGQAVMQRRRKTGSGKVFSQLIFRFAFWYWRSIPQSKTR